MAGLDLVGGRLPLPVGGGVAAGVAPSDVDVMLDAVPLWLCIGEKSPYQRETAQFQRDQVDQQPEAGEQSLAGWWTRSQMSFHMGAGLDYLDTSGRPDENDRVRFHTSRGVDVWTPGTLSLLPGSTLDRATPGGERVWLEAVTSGSTEYLALARASTIDVLSGGTWTTAAQATPLRAFCTDGLNLYYANAVGVYRAPVATPGTATLLFNTGADLPMVLGWAKQRLIFGYGQAVYSLDSVGPALPTANYTHPTVGWTWSSISDGPSGIIACGYAGLQSGMFKFELTKLDTTPILGPGVALLSMPAGERILATSYYLGSLLAVGTNRGVRICPFDSYYGTISLGPLSVETDGPVQALNGYDRYIYAGTLLDGRPALVRVDLSAPLDQQNHYAWAPDLLPPGPVLSGAVTAITVRADGRKWWGVQGIGLLTETLTPETQSCWLETARIRMGTVEDKNWAYGLVRGTYSAAAPLTVETNTGSGWSTAYAATGGVTRFGVRQARSEWLALRFTLTPGASLSSYQLQALPAGKRQRLISVPVWIADYQVTRSGVYAGYDGWAIERLAVIEAIEESGAETTLSAPALFPFAVRGVIEKLTYVQIDDPGDRGDGSGGQLQIILRTTA